MLEIKNEDVFPSIIENTHMKKVVIDGVHKAYTITSAEGFSLHDNTLDYENLNDELVLGFTQGEVSCPANYDFENNPREFYAKIEGGGDQKV